MNLSNGLLLFHCPSNTGYAIATLERTFDRSMRAALPEGAAIHYAYSSLASGFPAHIVDKRSEATEVPYRTHEDSYDPFIRWVQDRDITHVLAFDLPVESAVAKALRRGGVRRIVSYWGASISDVYPWYLRPLRRIQFLKARYRPDHFIFESEGMRERAVLGACIPESRTSVCHIGIDAELFRPAKHSVYAHIQLGIPPERRLVYFSGHMEERKGVHVLIDAFVQIHATRQIPVHLVLAGNTEADEQRLRSRFAGTAAEGFITFAGYRRDAHLLQQSASIGVIASTGWDSFTVSAVEMMATGLPLLVSDLPGLREAVIPQVTGERFPPGDSNALAEQILGFLSNEKELEAFGRAARERALREFSVETQVRSIASIVHA